MHLTHLIVSRVALVAWLVLLGGCTAHDLREQVEAEVTETGAGAIEALARVSRRDFEAAKASAEAAGDVRGAACWTALIPIADDLGDYRAEMEALEAAGSAYALRYQRTRNVRLWLADPPRGLDACRLMVDDSPSFLSRLVRTLGVLP